MRSIGHRPFGVHLESLPENPMTRAIPAYKVSDATRKEADKEFHSTHAGIGTAVFNRLILNDGARAVIILNWSALMRNSQLHRLEIQ